MKKKLVLPFILFISVHTFLEKSYSSQIPSDNFPTMKLHVVLTEQDCWGWSCDNLTAKSEQDVEIYLAEQSDGKTMHGEYSYPDSWHPGFENQLAIPYKFQDKNGNALIRLYYVQIDVDGTTNLKDEFTVKVTFYRQSNPTATILPRLKAAESVGSTLTFKTKLGDTTPTLTMSPIQTREPLENGPILLFGLQIMPTIKQFTVERPEQL